MTCLTCMTCAQSRLWKPTQGGGGYLFFFTPSKDKKFINIKKRTSKISNFDANTAKWQMSANQSRLFNAMNFTEVPRLVIIFIDCHLRFSIDLRKLIPEETHEFFIEQFPFKVSFGFLQKVFFRAVVVPSDSQTVLVSRLQVVGVFYLPKVFGVRGQMAPHQFLF